MTTPPGGTGGDKPVPDPADDPILKSASDAGWDDEPPRPRIAGPSFPAYVPPASPSPPSPTSSPPTSDVRATLPGTLPAIAPTATASSDEPLLPTTYDENDLRSAVGATPLADTSSKTRKPRAATDDEDEDDDEPPRSLRSRKTITVSALVAVASLAVGALVLVGRMNTDRYLLACEAERAVPKQGRGFPPWGTRALDGESWRPLKIAPETRCQPRETDDPRELERLYLAMILDQATALLTAREVTRLDEAEALLKQALLLTRPPERESEKLAAERTERRNDIQRLLGDVTYWRASAKVRDAANALGDAAKQFDSAAEQHPRHMSDAPAWAGHARKLVQQLTAGPAGATPAAGAVAPLAPVSPEHPGAPLGAALPIETGAGSSAESPAAPAPLDAGVPAGGVLL